MINFIIQREPFLKALRAVAGCVERKASQQLPILANVLLAIENHILVLTTSDQEVELTSKVVVKEVITAGRTTVSFRKLMDICRVLPDATVLNFSLENDKMIIRANRSRFSLSIIPADNFPNVKEETLQHHFTLNQKILYRLLGHCAFAMADQDVRFYLNGMLFEVKNKMLFLVAADGHRLALCSHPLSNPDISFRVIVPKKGVLELVRMLAESEGEVSLAFSDNHIRVNLQDISLTSKLLDAKFPEYEKLIPLNNSNVVIGKREALKEVFQRAAALFTEKLRAIQLNLRPGVLKILAKTPELDEVEEDLKIDYQGKVLEIGFNVRYLLDFLNVIETEEVKFSFSDGFSSVLMQGLGEELYKYVLMPMRI
ncbi:MAG: polymerase beta subunit [Francisellaceae bacterium]|nr:polymerase beta subunit [Francisellaceae bacterium]